MAFYVHIIMDATACSLIQTKELTFFHKANDDSLSVIISFLFKIQNSEMNHDTTIPGNNMICIYTPNYEKQ